MTSQPKNNSACIGSLANCFICLGCPWFLHFEIGAWFLVSKKNYQVIQAVTFLSPIVGGHCYQPFQRSLNIIPKRSRLESPDTLPETNIAIENGWLEYWFPFGIWPIFRCYLSFRESTFLLNASPSDISHSFLGPLLPLLQNCT